MKTKKWLGNVFESSCYKTDEFKDFIRDFRSDLNTMLKGTGWHIVCPFSAGHFYISGLLYNPFENKHVYISTSDVRFFRDEWYNHLLIRTAKNEKDFTGGANRYCRFYDLPLTLTQF